MGQKSAGGKLSGNELPGLTHQCAPDPERRIVPNALKRPVEKQVELLALSASACSRLQSVRGWPVTIEHPSFRQKFNTAKILCLLAINDLESI
jgi:hypothetical protein